MIAHPCRSVERRWQARPVRLDGAYSADALKEAIRQAVMELNDEEDLDRDLIGRVAHSGVGQGLLTSTIVCGHAPRRHKALRRKGRYLMDAYYHNLLA